MEFFQTPLQLGFLMFLSPHLVFGVQILCEFDGSEAKPKSYLVHTEA